MKSHDIVILFKLASLHSRFGGRVIVENKNQPNGIYSVRSLERMTGISKSQVNLSLNRMLEVGLAKVDRKSGYPKTNKPGLLEFIVYGIRYVFPAKAGELTRGIATSVAAPVLKKQLISAGELIPVWPDAQGNEKGLAIEPLHKNIKQAIMRDKMMYDLLALTDAIRIEQIRTRKIAVEKLTELLK